MARRIKAEKVSGNSEGKVTASAAIYRTSSRKVSGPVDTNRRSIAKPWQVEAYRHVNICGEARYAVTLFANTAARAEVGVSEPQALGRKAVWLNDGPEVEALAELMPSVRERAKIVRDYMTHRIIAGECYLIARTRVNTDPGYGVISDPIWEIVAVTELRVTGLNEDAVWSVRHENGGWIDLNAGDPVIRLWSPDPSNRLEAWSPFRSMLPTLQEIEWLTKHIFTQVRSRLMSAGVWFLPDNLTFPPPPPDAIEGDYETAMATMNEAEKFMVSLAASSMDLLDNDEVAFPSVVMAEPAALENVDQRRLIQFWAEIDDKAMTMRTDNVRRFALGMDLPPEQLLGSSGIAIAGSGGSAGSSNHWSIWSDEERTISSHIEPALDDFVAILTTSFLRVAVEGTGKVVGYDTATLRLRQDRSKEAIELYDRGLLNSEVTLREVGFDPANDKMSDKEFRRWLLVRLAGGSATPDQVRAAFLLLGVDLPASLDLYDESGEAPGQRSLPRSLKDHPYEGPPREDHDHKPAPYGVLSARCEGLVLRALEKAGNRLLNDGKRGRDKDRSTPPHLAHTVADVAEPPEFDFTLLPTALDGVSAKDQALVEARLRNFCAALYQKGLPFTREELNVALRGVFDVERIVF